MATEIASPAISALTPDELDDLIYFARTGDLPSLTSSFTQISTSHKISPSTLLKSAIDIDSDSCGSQCTLLHFAAANNHLDILHYLLALLLPSERKPEESFVDRKNASGNTALHWGAMNGHLEIVKALVEVGGVDVSVLNEAGQDAIYVAEVSGKESGVECAEWLLKHGVGLDTGVAGFAEDEGEGEGEAEVDGEAGLDEEGHKGGLVEKEDEIINLANGVAKTHVTEGG